MTVGNNVAAYADLGAPDYYNGDTDLLGWTSDTATFDWPYDLEAEPYATFEQVEAAVTQLFYDNNFFHDWFYDSGFDEASGNAQWDNSGAAASTGTTSTPRPRTSAAPTTPT